MCDPRQNELGRRDDELYQAEERLSTREEDECRQEVIETAGHQTDGDQGACDSIPHENDDMRRM